MIKSNGKTIEGLAKEREKIKWWSASTDAKEHTFGTPFAHATIILTATSTKTWSKKHIISQTRHCGR
jgi:hypothetical protein